MSIKNFIPYGYQTISKRDRKTVLKSLYSKFLTNGPATLEFEKKFKKFVNAKYAVSCSNGTSALHLCFMAIDLKKDEVVIVPVINFIASINMAYLMGAKIFFADVDKLTGQMTPDTLEKCINENKIKKIKAVVTMYNGGSANNAEEFFKLKKKYNFFLIEDACHALGSVYSEKKKSKIGSNIFSDLSTFSFHPLKTITTGEGGMVATNNYKLNQKMILAKNHGMVRKKNNKHKYNWSYKIVYPGFNYRLNDISCSLGISQLNKINFFLKKRIKISNTYFTLLKKYKNYLHLANKEQNQNSANHLYIVILKKKIVKLSRDKILQKLYQKKIFTQVHYIPIYKHPFYKKIAKGNYPNAEFYFQNCISLPIFPNLNTNQIKYICDCLIKILKIKNVK